MVDWWVIGAFIMGSICGVMAICMFVAIQHKDDDLFDEKCYQCLMWRDKDK